MVQGDMDPWGLLKMENNIPEQEERDRITEELYHRFSKRGRWRLRIGRFIRGLVWLCIVQLASGGKRVLDVLISFLLLLVVWPILLLSYLTPGTTLKRTPVLGRWCARFDRYSFNTSPNLAGKILRISHIDRWPVLFNVLKGDLSFIGPRAIPPGELDPREKAVRKRYNVRPGLISLWWIRQRANIDFTTEVAADGEYVETQSIWGDVGIALRAIPAVIYGGGVGTAPDLVTILGIPINNYTMDEAIETIMDQLNRDVCCQVCFVNADCANIAYCDDDYLTILKRAGPVHPEEPHTRGGQSFRTFCFADGIGLKIAGKLLAREIRQNVNGTDLFPLLCEALSGSGKGLFLLGAEPGVAEGVREWIREHHPAVIVRGIHHGFFSPEEEEPIIQRIADSGADLLLVAFGAPRQDKWIFEHIEKTGVKVAMGVGGLFDFYSGKTPRAPLWMREMGMEWLYRFIQEPGRLWKRYFIGNFVFLYRVILERIRGEAREA